MLQHQISFQAKGGDEPADVEVFCHA
jgi:hypothetical protein